MEKKKKILMGITISIIIATSGITSYFVAVDINYKNTLDYKIKELMNQFEIPSLAAGIILNNSLIWSGGFGNQSDSDTVFMIGSITKTFTATAILQLHENGTLDIDDDVNLHLPFEVRHPDYPSKNISIRMLLMHKAGLPANLYWSLEYYFDNSTIDWINNNLGWEIEIWEHRPTLEYFLNESLNRDGKYYNAHNWQSKPGTEFLYSNASYQLLGFLIESVTNQTLESYVKESIFDPLCMENTGYRYEDFLNSHAIPYEWNGTNIEFPLYNINVTGAGSIRSTLYDMTKFMTCFMNQGTFNGTQILSSQSVQFMHSIQVYLEGTSTEGYDIEGYGLGWWVYSENIIGHAGATPGFSANMVIKYTDTSNFGIMLMFNRGSALIYDELLIDEFIPMINLLLLEETEKFI